ncbi:male-enhanced antigen 1 [Phlebotomus papatasi]|uniref:Male-enhanced antigen 1 n=1 Tax=Phlebotomus papatasi TaxID=29031 RepID=A0A1B0DD78_PHLPP|nr:male-enhanced antigen 1 [Phlebotomus papatasi]
MQFKVSGESDPGDGNGDEIVPNMGTTFYQQNTSDDSDNDQEMYDGYEPLNGEPQNVEVWDNLESTEDTDMSSGIPSADVPPVDTVEREVQREVWNAERPECLTIDLDGDKEREIMNVMAGFSLPEQAIPAWAHGVSEKEWKDDLLKRIREKKSQ